ncbi:MAG: sulfatase-like hydrolase/transferase [Anaerolineae bacterium]|nr:sulfatase-like hydrolase/transferase [Anaerolineae bacterium]
MKKKKRPNILWIQSDEHRPDSLGCYGSPWAKTPHLDRLASRGIVYQNCVCNSPVCVPSRASQLTARYPQEVNVLLNQVSDEHHINETENVYPSGTLTFPEVFESAGYATASFGKWHVPVHKTWQVNKSLVNIDAYSGYYALNEAYDEAEHHVIKRPGGTSIILAGTYPVAEGHPSQVITDWAVEWLRSRDKEKPFLLRISHNWPHTPVLAPPPFDQLYDPDDIPIRYYDEQAYLTRSSRDRRIADGQRMKELSRDQIRQVWKDYMGLVACVDHEVGRALSILEELGLLENTIVLFSADHGKALGEWGATEKGFYDAEVWRVPFILAGPGVPSAGKIDHHICELVDTGRTLCNLAGVDVPAQFKGRDLINEAPRDAVYGQIGWPDPDAPLVQRMNLRRRRGSITSAMRSAVRTQRYRMDVTFYMDGATLPIEQADGNLFDLELDPGETRNLWDDPAAQDIKNALWQKLLEWDKSMDHPSQIFS